MKNIAIIILTLVLNTACAQQIVSIESIPIGTTPNVYYKDTNNVLHYFEGTWLYTSGNTQLKLVIEKKTQYYDPAYNNYIDFLVGEYQYIENGVEIVNTLNRLNDPNVGLLEHGINGNLILFKNIQEFSESSPSVVVDVKFVDPERTYVNSKSSLHYANGNQTQIQFILHDENSIIPYAGAPMDLRVPLGEYTLTKQ